MNQRIFAEPETGTRHRSRLTAATAALALAVLSFTAAGLAAVDHTHHVSAGIRPATPSYCFTRRDYSANPDRFWGGCNGGTGIFQVEGVCYLLDGGPYVVGSSPWFNAPATSPRYSCPFDHPLLYTVRLDFTKP